MKILTVGKNDAGQRLDKFLTKAVRGLPKSLMYKSIRTKKIKLNRRRAQPDDMLCEGDEVQLFLREEFFESPESDRGALYRIKPALDIVFEDENIILGNKNKHKVLEYLKEYESNHKRIVDFEDMNKDDIDFDDMEIKEYKHHHRAFIKIEDGCNNFCSYCIIPYVRGRVRSKEFNKCLMEINDLALSGHKEIVLSGIHTGQYNSDGKRLSKRIRLSSVEIVELDDKMMDIIKNNNKFVSHLHIPLQAGSDHILKLMNRRYDKKHFKKLVDKIRENRNDISLTTDVIVGFPGETEEDFKETLDFCEEIGFTKIHVFPYSDRSGTVASRMKDKIPGNIKKDRVRRLIDLSNKLEKEYYLKHIDKEDDVLIEEVKQDGYLHGFTSDYIPIKLKGNYKINEIYKIKLSKENINFSLD